MAFVNIFKFPISSPGDTSGLGYLKNWGYDASQVLAVIGKTEGNGCVNDFSRALGARAWARELPAAVTIFSGGTEGVLSPHVTFVVRCAWPSGLLAAAGRTRVIEPHEIGTQAHAMLVGEAVAALVRELRVSKENVQLVLVKCPLLTTAKLEIIRLARKTPVTTDTYDSMAKSRYASAVGVGIGLGELDAFDLHHRFSKSEAWCARASCSSGAELDDCHIVIFATSPKGGLIKVTSKCMEDAIDTAAIKSLLDQVEKDEGEIVQVFAKAEADPSGFIRGFRHTMLTDSDIHSTRHARAAVGGLIAGLVNDTQIYVSGGAEGQGPPGGGNLCIIYKCRRPGG